MATTAQIDALAALYAGYFDRAPDPAGLQFWINEIDNGRDFNTIAADFATSSEATALYPYLTTPDLVTPTTFVTSIYLNLFNRSPDDAGLKFWTDALDAGTVSAADMVEDIINGARDDAAATPPSFDKATLDNKVAVGRDFAESAAAAAGYTFDIADAKAAIGGVTNDAATVTAAKAATDVSVSGDAASIAIYNAALATATPLLTAAQTATALATTTAAAATEAAAANLDAAATAKTTADAAAADAVIANAAAVEALNEVVTAAGVTVAEGDNTSSADLLATANGLSVTVTAAQTANIASGEAIDTTTGNQAAAAAADDAATSTLATAEADVAALSAANAAAQADATALTEAATTAEDAAATAEDDKATADAAVVTAQDAVDAATTVDDLAAAQLALSAARTTQTAAATAATDTAATAAAARLAADEAIAADVALADAVTASEASTAAATAAAAEFTAAAAATAGTADDAAAAEAAADSEAVAATQASVVTDSAEVMAYNAALATATPLLTAAQTATALATTTAATATETVATNAATPTAANLAAATAAQTVADAAAADAVIANAAAVEALNEVVTAADATIATEDDTSSADLLATANGLSVTVTAAQTANTASGEAIVTTTANQTEQTFTLTTGADKFIGGSGNDTFQGVDFATSVTPTLTNFDELDGGVGVDTLDLIVKGRLDVPGGVSISNIEVINLERISPSGGTIDASVFAGATQIWQIDNAGDISNLVEGQIAGFRDTNINFDEVTYDAGVTVASVALDNVDTNSTLLVNGADVETLNVSGTVNNPAGPPTADITIDLGDLLPVGGVDAITTLNLALTTDTDVAVVGNNAFTLETIDASGSTGGITATIPGAFTDAYALESITGGSGADALTLTRLDDLGADTLEVSGGAGNDVFTIIDTSQTGTAVAVTFTGGDGNDTLDLNADVNFLANVTDALEANFMDSLITFADFNGDEDVLDIGVPLNTLSNTERGNIAAEANLFDAVELAASFMTSASASETVAFDYDGDAYVFSSVDNTFSDNDGLVKLVGFSVENIDASNVI